MKPESVTVSELDTSCVKNLHASFAWRARMSSLKPFTVIARALSFSSTVSSISQMSCTDLYALDNIKVLQHFTICFSFCTFYSTLLTPPFYFVFHARKAYLPTTLNVINDVQNQLHLTAQSAPISPGVFL